MQDMMRDIRRLLRDELTKLDGRALIQVTLPDGNYYNISAFNLLDSLVRKVRLPEPRNAREFPTKNAVLAGSYKEGDVLWVYGEESGGYTRLLDHPGWLYTEGIKFFCC